MKPTQSDYHLSPSAFRNRLVWYLLALLVMQSLIAYGALLLLDALPHEITGIPDESNVQRDSQRGTASLLKAQIIAAAKVGQEQALLEQLQPKFGYPLQLLPAHTALSDAVQKQLQYDSIAYDVDNDVLYAPINDKYILEMGPIISQDILDANVITTIVHLLLWSVLSAITFFVLLYFALAPLWRDALMICETAQQLAAGNLQSRTPEARSWLFKPLADVLDNMAVKIEYLVQNSKMISQTMAHELRTPLARIHFALSMLEEAQTGEERERYLAGVYGDIRELESLINISLDFFRMQQRKAELNCTEIALCPWCESICRTLKPFKPKNFELQCHVEDSTAYFDGKLGSIIIKNLLLNAFKYASSQVLLTIKTQAQGIQITVDDDGPGIPPESRNEIFTPFFRLDNSRTRASDGYGLGLAYVRLIAELHKGNAFVLSSSLGGARFVVLLNAIK